MLAGSRGCGLGNDHVGGSTDRLAFVQALRGLAAVAVVLYHVRYAVNGPAYLDLGERLFGSGYAGVDLFFVLSGFIMVHTTWSLAGTRRDAVRFLLKRFARIWPVYVLVTLAFVLVVTDLDDAFSAEGLVALAKAFGFYPQRIGGAPMFGFPPDGVGWTLNYEVWFYVLFALALLAGRWRWVAVCGLFGLCLIVLPWAVTGGVQTSAYAGYDLRPAILNILASPLSWEFLLGVLIGLVYRSRLVVRDGPLLDSIVAAAITLVLWQYVAGFPFGYGPLAMGRAMPVLVLALALRDKVRPFRVPRWLTWLGDISFSLYLVHPIVQLGLPRWLGPQHAPLVQGGAFALASTVGAILLAHLSWRYLEQGVAERVRTWLLARRFAA